MSHILPRKHVKMAANYDSLVINREVICPTSNEMESPVETTPSPPIVSSPYDFDFGKTFENVYDLRAYVQQWAMHKRIPFRIKFSGTIQYMVLCPTTVKLSKAQRIARKSCEFCISSYCRNDSRSFSFSKNCEPKHFEKCIALKITAPAKTVKMYISHSFISVKDIKPKSTVNIVRENCGLSIPYYTS